MSKKLFFPVIHCVSPDIGGIGHAIANARTANHYGADGVFLIGHSLHFSDLCYIYENVRKQFPDLWIGVNFLDIAAEKNWVGLSAASKRCYDLDALWIDQMPESRLELHGVTVFGGVAFKYINSNLKGNQLAIACEKAKQVIDVVTTSGDKTGEPPSLAKLSEIRGHVGKEPSLAIASGVDENNILPMLGIADIFLVASSISERNPNNRKVEDLVPNKVQKLADLIHTANE